MKIGKVHLHFKTITSTNDFACDLISKISPISGTVITADFQSKGRGQFDRSWVGTPDENIAATIIYKPEYLAITHQFYLNKCIALAVRESVATYVKKNVRTEIKWPNDILVNDQKVSGILIQNVLQGHTYKYSIIGMGINIMQTSWPKMDIHPTSILLNTDKKIDKNEILFYLFRQCDHFLHLLEKKDFEQIDSLYHEFIYQKDQSTKIVVANEEVLVTIRGVDSMGRLCVDYNGSKEFFEYGNVKILYKN